MEIRRVGPPALGAAALLVLILWMAGSFNRGRIEPGSLEPRPGGPAPEHTLQVREEAQTTWYEAVGTVRSRAQTTVATQITGQILDVQVEAGDHVKEGQVLANLDSREYAARLEQARSALVSAQAERELATTAYNRFEGLFEKRAVTLEQFESVEAQRKQADAAVSAAEQKVEEAQTLLGYTTLHSPMDGVVADRLAEPGDLAYPGKALLVVHDPEDLRLEANVREGLISRIRSQMAEGREVEVHLDAIERSVRGRITEIVPAADPVSRSFLVKVSLPRTAGVYPGMFGKLRCELDPRPAILIPESAVVRVGQLATVRVRQDERWERRFVTLGNTRDGRVEVLSGLREGEEIGWD
jgi:RND family efflux transporter MFP subunit